MQFANLSKKQFEMEKQRQVVVPTHHLILDQTDSHVTTEAFINNFLEGTAESTYADVARGG
jgi:hypothetical protein